MPNARQEASLTQVRRLLSRWDQGFSSCFSIVKEFRFDFQKVRQKFVVKFFWILSNYIRRSPNLNSKVNSLNQRVFSSHALVKRGFQ